MNKKQVADKLHSEFVGFMKQAWPECPKGGIQWREQWKAFLGGAMTTITIAWEDPETILIIGEVTADLAKQTVQPGRRN